MATISLLKRLAKRCLYKNATRSRHLCADGQQPLFAINGAVPHIHFVPAVADLNNA
jgi:hypothetical protein